MFSKISCLCAFLAVAHASILLAPAPIVSTGVSASSRQQDGHGNYAFAYDIVDGKGATNSRSEVGDAAGNKKGSYSLSDIDGRARRVDYVADGHGFRAAVKTNEPGTALSAPAAAVIDSPYAAPVAPVASAPVIAAAPLLTKGAPFIAAPSVSTLNGIIGHGIVPQVSAYSSVIGHSQPVFTNVIGHRIASPLGLNLIGSPLGKSLIW